MSEAHEAHALVTSPGVHELFSLINVGVVVLITVIFGGKGIKEVFKGRSQKLRDDLVSSREELKKILQEIEVARNHIANIEKEKAILLGKVEEEGKALARRLVDEARAASDRIKEDAGRAALAEFAELREKLKADLLDSLVAKLRDEFSAETSQQKLHEKLIDGFVNQPNAAGANS